MKLLTEISAENETKTIIFVETKRRVDDITRNINRNGWRAVSIHGDKSQQERDYVLNAFRNGRQGILVATDVAARGLDVEDVKFVINYDYPSNSEDYVHRIGRTGRSNNTGTAYTLFTNSNANKAGDLINVLREANQVINPKLAEMAKPGMNRHGQRHNRYGNRYGGQQNRPPRDGGYGGQRNDGGHRFGGMNNGNKFGGPRGDAGGDKFGSKPAQNGGYPSRDQNRIPNGSGPPSGARPSRFSAPSNAPPSFPSGATGGNSYNKGAYQNGSAASGNSAPTSNGYGSYKPYTTAPPTQSATGASFGGYQRSTPAVPSAYPSFGGALPQPGQTFAFPPPAVALN